MLLGGSVATSPFYFQNHRFAFCETANLKINKGDCIMLLSSLVLVEAN
jgi:hypothetical protein